MVGSFTIVIIAKDYEQTAKAEFQIDDCPQRQISEREVLKDLYFPQEDQQGLLHCFCLEAYN